MSIRSFAHYAGHGLIPFSRDIELERITSEDEIVISGRLMTGKASFHAGLVPGLTFVKSLTFSEVVMPTRFLNGAVGEIRPEESDGSLLDERIARY